MPDLMTLSGRDPQPVTPQAFRSSLGLFASGVVVVTTLDAAGDRRGVTVSSFSSLSLDPPLVLWSLKSTSPCLEAFLHSGVFAVNVLSAEQEAVSRAFCGKADRFAGVACREGLEGAPLIEGSLAWLECRLWRTFEGGDHVILTGEVVRCTPFEGEPLIHWRAGYRALALPEQARPAAG